MKKTLALLLAILMMFALVACGQPAADDAKDDGAAEGQTELTMWCIATESDSNRHSYEAAIAEMEEAHPEIKLTWEATENEAYKTKIKAAVAADEMPDIFFTWSCGFLGDFVDAGRVYCLDDVYADYIDQIPEAMLANTTYGGSHYGVPLTMNIVTLFANMDILAQVGYDAIPDNYDDLMACCDKLIEAGIIPFGCSGKETWCVTEYLEPLIANTCGSDTLKEIELGNESWDNEGVVSAVDTLQSYIEKGYFDPDGIALSNDEVKANFIAGKYAFYQNGSWNCADFAGNDEFKDKVQCAAFPVIGEGLEGAQLVGGPNDTLAVAASSPNAEIAAQFCIELGRAICHYGYLDGCGLPAWTPDYDTSDINPLTQTVSDICANAGALVLFGDNLLSADAANTYLSYVDQAYGCQIDGAGFVAGLAKDIG